jgi:Glycosyl hydrolases family 2, TIM barrel domain
MIGFLTTYSAIVMCMVVSAIAAPIPVKMTDTGLQRGGVPYFVKGVGGEKDLTLLAQLGGNSVRTWSENGLKELLEEADKNGITVCAGIWIESECSWFSYRNPEHCARQLARVRKSIETFRDAPALLLWNIGNEAEGDGANEAYWKQLNALCKMAKEVDPNHPSINAVAGLSAAKAKGIVDHCPDLDIIGINTYGGLKGLRAQLEKQQWKKPWIVTEFGPAGYWERPKTSWDRPIEQTSTEKADTLRTAYEKSIKPAGHCFGSYAFLWGQKQEATFTWFGLRTPSGETTASIDELRHFWTGKKVDNAAPSISPVVCSANKKIVKIGNTITASVASKDPDGDTLSYRWELYGDDIRKDKNNREIKPPKLAESDHFPQTSAITLQTPAKPGSYRLFVFVTDGKGHAATANVPFRVEP